MPPNSEPILKYDNDRCTRDDITPDLVEGDGNMDHSLTDQWHMPDFRHAVPSISNETCLLRMFQKALATQWMETHTSMIVFDPSYSKV